MGRKKLFAKNEKHKKRCRPSIPVPSLLWSVESLNEANVGIGMTFVSACVSWLETHAGKMILCTPHCFSAHPRGPFQKGRS